MEFLKLADGYLSEKNNNIKPGSISAYSIIIKSLLQEYKLVQEINNSSVQKFVIEQTKKGKSKNYIKNMLMVLKEILKFGSKKGYCNFFEFNIDLPTILDTRGRKSSAFSVKETILIRNYLIENVYDNNYNLAILLALSTGMRIGEITALKFSDIDFEKRLLSVNRTSQRLTQYDNKFNPIGSKVNIGSPKSKSSVRKIPLEPDVFSILTNVYNIEKIKRKNKEYEDFIFIGTRKKGIIDNRTLRQNYNLMIKNIGVSTIPFHSLRHTFASNCIASNVDIKTTSAIIGHSNVKTTLDVYAHPSFEQKKSAINKVTKLF